MIILALDTTLASCSVALFDAGAGRMLAARQLLMDKGHAEAIAPLVQRCLQEAGVWPSSIARIAIGAQLWSTGAMIWQQSPDLFLQRLRLGFVHAAQDVFHRLQVHAAFPRVNFDIVLSKLLSFHDQEVLENVRTERRPDPPRLPAFI